MLTSASVARACDCSCLQISDQHGTWKNRLCSSFSRLFALHAAAKCAMGCHLLGQVIKLGLGLGLEEGCQGAQVQAFWLDYLLIL